MINKPPLRPSFVRRGKLSSPYEGEVAESSRLEGFLTIKKIVDDFRK